MNEMVLRDICETLKGIKGELEKMNKIFASPLVEDTTTSNIRTYTRYDREQEV